MSNYSYATRWTRDEKKAVLSNVILEAWTEQETEARQPLRGKDDPFESRAFRTERLDHLVHLIKTTEALELLAEMVGAINEEVSP